jgi:NADH pyrophosphatase NudC (nudix superfamily)
MSDYKYCPNCACPLTLLERNEDGGKKLRNSCTACGWTHWNNPTPVLAAVVEYQGKILLARNAAWTGKRFALIAGFMEAGETPEEGIKREIAEETNLCVESLSLIGVYEFIRKNQIIIAYHASTLDSGVIKLSPELIEYRLFEFEDIICWTTGTGYALGDWLKTQSITPRFMAWEDIERINETV